MLFSADWARLTLVAECLLLFLQVSWNHHSVKYIFFKLLLLNLTYDNISDLLLSNQSAFSLLRYLNNTQTLALNTQCYIVCGCLSEE